VIAASMFFVDAPSRLAWNWSVSVTRSCGRIESLVADEVQRLVARLIR
jgi:hypothetical protein